jgi:hypothetical protein
MIICPFRVDLGTMDKGTLFFSFFQTNLTLKVIRMILTFMPPMTVEALEAFAACILIHTDCLCSVPLGAGFG